MHEACARDFICNAETRADDNDARLFASPMFRLPFRKQNIVLLKSTVPSKTSAVAWRTVQLTNLWEARSVESLSMRRDRFNEHRKGAFRELIEELQV